MNMNYQATIKEINTPHGPVEVIVRSVNQTALDVASRYLHDVINEGVPSHVPSEDGPTLELDETVAVRSGDHADPSLDSLIDARQDQGRPHESIADFARAKDDVQKLLGERIEGLEGKG